MPPMPDQVEVYQVPLQAASGAIDGCGPPRSPFPEPVNPPRCGTLFQILGFRRRLPDGSRSSKRSDVIPILEEEGTRA